MWTFLTKTNKHFNFCVLEIYNVDVQKIVFYEVNVKMYLPSYFTNLLKYN